MEEPPRISKQIKMIHNAFEEKRNRQLLKYRLTSSQMDVLLCLRVCKEREIHQREIEKWLRLKNPTVTGILNRLEENGFIVRRTNPDDRRFRRIELTEKSTQVINEICEEIWETDRRLYSCMSHEEQRQLAELLDRILQSLSEKDLRN